MDSESPSRDRKVALAVFVLSFLLFNANLRVVGCKDSYSARFLPFSIWKAGALDFEPVLAAALQRDIDPYWMFPTKDGRRGSIFPIVTPVVITPLYAPAAAYLQWRDWRQEDLERVAMIMDKVSASFVTSIAVAIVFVLIRRRLPLADAILLTMAFALGTSTWSTSSQSLWLHGVAELFGALALWAVTSAASRTNAIIAGAAISLFVMNRPPDIFIGAAVALYALFWARRYLVSFLLAGLVPAALVVAYNLHTFGHPLGAWGLAFTQSYFIYPMIEGIAGMLVSPSRGLFVFSPFLLLLPCFLNRVIREPRERLLAIALLAGIALQIAFYARSDWRAGASYGPRYLADAMPFLVWLMIPIVASLDRARRWTFAALVLISICIHYVGVFHYTGVSNGLLIPTHPPYETHEFWAMDRAQFLIEARNPVARPELAYALRALGDPPPPEMLRKSPPAKFHAVERCTLFAETLRSGSGFQIFPVPGKCGVPSPVASVTGIVTAYAADAGGVFLSPHNGGPWKKIDVAKRSSGPVTIPVSQVSGSVRAFATLARKDTVRVRFDVIGYSAVAYAGPLPDSAYRVHWEHHTMPPSVSNGSRTRVQVTFTNTSDSVWPDPATADPSAGGARAVRLSYDWYPPAGDLTPQKDGPRIDLPHPLGPGESITLTADVFAPATPGRYRLVFELVQELVTWFDTKGGSQLEVPVAVD